MKFQVDVKRTSRKKTASRKIEQGVVQVIVPQNLPQKEIDDLLKQKSDWIRQKVIIQQSVPASKPKEFVSGESFTYLGRNYRLKVLPGQVEPVKLKHGYLHVTVPPDQKSDHRLIRQRLRDWYLHRAIDKLEQKSIKYSEQMGVQPTQIKVKEYKSRWGSCNSRGEISYNWKIIMTPHRIVDYLVVHELSHLIHHNHSKQYWNQVRSIVPDYQDRRDWLKTNAGSLNW
ncbi:MAG: SprT family zinc-dependent metalloprotease [Candidatus Poribacteria bacterium]|nr:SprT family zinc-dependent metalloprotease [Candidatus Poribacteria bacterium]